MNDLYDQCECPLCHNTGFVSSEDYDEYTAVEAENERLKNENIVRISALNNLHHNLRELQRRNALLENVAEAAQDILWVFDCTCIEAYTDRGLHEPNAICGEGDGLSAALAALERPE